MVISPTICTFILLRTATTLSSPFARKPTENYRIWKLPFHLIEAIRASVKPQICNIYINQGNPHHIWPPIMIFSQISAANWNHGNVCLTLSRVTQRTGYNTRQFTTLLISIQCFCYLVKEFECQLQIIRHTNRPQHPVIP